MRVCVCLLSGWHGILPPGLFCLAACRRRVPWLPRRDATGRESIHRRPGGAAHSLAQSSAWWDVPTYYVYAQYFVLCASVHTSHISANYNSLMTEQSSWPALTQSCLRLRAVRWAGSVAGGASGGGRGAKNPNARRASWPPPGGDAAVPPVFSPRLPAELGAPPRAPDEAAGHGAPWGTPAVCLEATRRSAGSRCAGGQGGSGCDGYLGVGERRVSRARYSGTVEVASSPSIWATRGGRRTGAGWAPPRKNSGWP